MAFIERKKLIQALERTPSADKAGWGSAAQAETVAPSWIDQALELGR